MLCKRSQKVPKQRSLIWMQHYARAAKFYGFFQKKLVIKRAVAELVRRNLDMGSTYVLINFISNTGHSHNLRATVMYNLICV